MIYIFLPVFNEEKNIENLLQSIENFWLNKIQYEQIKIVIVDDGSKDDTNIKILDFDKRLKEKFYNNFEIKYIKHDMNCGLGSAVKTGLEYIIANNNNDKSILITMDGDNSHQIENISPLMHYIKEGYKVTICSRYAYGKNIEGVPFFRIIIANIGSIIFPVMSEI